VPRLNPNAPEFCPVISAQGGEPEVFLGDLRGLSRGEVIQQLTSVFTSHCGTMGSLARAKLLQDFVVAYGYHLLTVVGQGWGTSFPFSAEPRRDHRDDAVKDAI
jgi:hypothetical protein